MSHERIVTQLALLCDQLPSMWLQKSFSEGTRSEVQKPSNHQRSAARVYRGVRIYVAAEHGWEVWLCIS